MKQNWRRWKRHLGKAAIGVLLLPVALLLPLRWVDPWFTGVQAQRRVESWFGNGRYEKRYTPVPIGKISPHLRHAVVAAEDGRFWQHWGLDLVEIGKAAEKGLETQKPVRGASTITQQLVKNLFFTTHRNPVRKVAEFGLAPAAELLLGKERILELYLNSVEWGPGVFGAEEAARYHYRVGSGSLSREQAARLAACLPAPRRRRPGAMNRYGGVILGRMAQMGW